jgi:hypothetical protein
MHDWELGGLAHDTTGRTLCASYRSWHHTRGGLNYTMQYKAVQYGIYGIDIAAILYHLPYAYPRQTKRCIQHQFRIEPQGCFAGSYTCMH